MTLHILRALFVLFMASIGYAYLKHVPGPFGEATWATLSVCVTLAVLILALDILSGRRKLLVLSGLAFGLVVGLAVAFVLGFTADWIGDIIMPVGNTKDNAVRVQLIEFIKVLLNIVCCYLAVSFIMQSKDDIRFIIPYVEFAKQTRGARPIVLDTNILIDGRIVDLADLGMIDSRLVVPRFVLDELQTLADCPDRLKRNRGRRGLDILAKLQTNRNIDVLIYDVHLHEDDQSSTVDQQLVDLAAKLEGRLLTTDFNLQQVGQLHRVDVINLNQLAKALKPVVLPGERINVQLLKPGEQPGQGVGYLEDGTMVVVEQGRPYIGKDEVEATVTGVVQTSAGRMVFSMIGDSSQIARRGRRQLDNPTPQPQAPAS